MASLAFLAGLGAVSAQVDGANVGKGARRVAFWSAVAMGGDRAERDRELEACLRDERARHRHDDPHLRICNAVTGHHIHATDGEIGDVSGFFADDETWATHYLVIDTSSWWVGHKVLIAPPWIKHVHGSDKTVDVDLGRDASKKAPTCDPLRDWTRDRDLTLYRHYGRSGAYWAGSPVRESDF